jgi:uncharacterized membrane protein
MSIVKNIVIALVVILGIVVAGSYFLPNHYTVTNTIEINKPADVVYTQLADFNKWGIWAPWREKDPAVKYAYAGVPGTKGHKLSWDGPVTGTGSSTIYSCTANQVINANLNFEKPFKAFARDHIKLEGTGNKTTVTWTTEGWYRFPVGRLKGLAFGKMINTNVNEAQTQSLANLKKFCELIPAPLSADTTAAITAQ